MASVVPRVKITPSLSAAPTKRAIVARAS